MSVSPVSSTPLLLFGKARRPLGWQGYSTSVPAGWNPGKYSGTRARGDLRVDDENGVRFELRWEESLKTPDVEKSVANFLQSLQKDAKKRKTTFEIIEDAKVVSRGRKNKQQVTSFGWIGDPKAETPCGFGAAWFCPTCNRVTFAHIVGQPGEKVARIERLAPEILGPLECHGEGGWDKWSFFDFQLEIPTEFELSRAQILLSKIEMEWVRKRPVGIYGWGRRAERLKLWRFPAASALLGDLSLEDWTRFNLLDSHKQLVYSGPAEAGRVNGHDALRYEGRIKDPRQWVPVWFFDKLLRRVTPRPTLQVWDCPVSNRIWALESEVSRANLHVGRQALDSLQCHEVNLR